MQDLDESIKQPQDSDLSKGLNDDSNLNDDDLLGEMRMSEPFSEAQSSIRGSYNPNPMGLQSQNTLNQMEMDNIPEEDEDLDTTIKMKGNQDEIVNILMKGEAGQNVDPGQKKFVSQFVLPTINKRTRQEIE